MQGPNASSTQLEEAVERAAKAIQAAGILHFLDRAASALTFEDAIVLCSGAGLGVDSNLGTFRGRNAATWPPLAERNLGFSDMSNPQWFEAGEDAHLGWGFWWWRYNSYVNESKPHAGYHIMMKWAQGKKHGGFSYTSNIDGHWQAAGMPEERLCEIHGSIRYMQCIHSTKCSTPYDIWPAQGLDVRIDPNTHKAVDPLPRYLRQVSDRTRQQQGRWREWLEILYREHAKVAIVEVGAGIAIPSIRYASENLINDPAALDAALIRINLEHPEIVTKFNSLQKHVSLGLGGLDALQRIDAKISPQQ